MKFTKGIKMLKTNLDLGNGVILKDVRVWEVEDGMPECQQGFLNMDPEPLVSWWLNADSVLSVDGFFTENGADKWKYYIPLTEIVNAAIRMGREQ